MGTSLETRIQEKTDRIETVIDAFLPEETGYQKTVLSAMNYTMKAGGKRLRPMLMEESYFLPTNESYFLVFQLLLILLLDQ